MERNFELIHETRIKIIKKHCIYIFYIRKILTYIFNQLKRLVKRLFG